jgi:hypothetical protein
MNTEPKAVAHHNATLPLIATKGADLDSDLIRVPLVRTSKNPTELIHQTIEIEKSIMCVTYATTDPQPATTNVGLGQCAGVARAGAEICTFFVFSPQPS